MLTLMSRGALALGVFVFVAAAAPQPAPPQPCASPVLPADQRIKACLAATQTKGASRDQLAADYAELASSYEAWGNRKRELDALNKAISLKPDKWDSRIKRSQLLLQSAMFEQAVPDFLALRKAFPGPAPVLKSGQTLTDPAQKIAFMIPSLQRELLMRSVRRCRARAVVGLEIEGARKDCQLAIQFDMNNQATPAHESLGIAEFRDGDWPHALAEFETVLKLNPKQWSSLYLRGICERRMGKTAVGDADIATAKKNAPMLERQGYDAGLLP